MATFDLPEIPAPRVSPQMMVGAASPLWGYFGAAAAGGMAYWWMTRWGRPVNLEALFDAAARALPDPDAIEGAIEAIEEAVEEAMLPIDPVGGESAPISPLVETAAEPPEVEAASEPEVAEARPRARKTPAPSEDAG